MNIDEKKAGNIKATITTKVTNFKIYVVETYAKNYKKVMLYSSKEHKDNVQKYINKLKKRKFDKNFKYIKAYREIDVIINGRKEKFTKEVTTLLPEK